MTTAAAIVLGALKIWLSLLHHAMRRHRSRVTSAPASRAAPTQPSARRSGDVLLAVLAEATEKVMRYRPGFVSEMFHLSLDRTHVANYARWRSKADFDATVSDPTAKEPMDKAGGGS
jgi:Antibiotic biosynthesis monooxygenase